MEHSLFRPWQSKSPIIRIYFYVEVFSMLSNYVFSLAGGYFIIVYYMPIYFQTVGSSSALRSGIQTLPLILSACKQAIGLGSQLTTN